jgi:nucleoside-diphosphate-sugar epimerase
MNYYVSGSSGFIGTAITAYLRNIGESVYRIPRHKTKKELIQLFSTDKPDVIIHLATYGNHYKAQKDFGEMIYTNILFTHNLLEAAQVTGCEKFYNFTATSVSGEFYYTTKICAEMLAEKYGAINIRPYSVYGPGESRNKLIPTIIKNLCTGERMTLDGEATHAWIYIDDLVRGMFEGKTELGGSEKISNIEVAHILEHISGKELNYTLGKVRSYDNDNWTTPEGVNYTPLIEGLTKTYKYYKI